MKTFIELEKEYQALRHKIEHTLVKLAWYCSEFIDNHEELFEGCGDYVENPYSLSFGEEYSSHHYEAQGEVFHVTFEYKDSYDEILDSVTFMEYPVDWVEASFTSKLEKINDELAAILIRNHHESVYNEKREAILKASYSKIITLEESKEKLRELDENSSDYWLTQKKK